MAEVGAAFLFVPFFYYMGAPLAEAVPTALLLNAVSISLATALKHVRSPFLDLMRGILQSDACIRRGLSQGAYLEKLRAEPEGHFTRIRGSKRWPLAVLEWWLQVNVDGAQ